MTARYPAALHGAPAVVRVGSDEYVATNVSLTLAATVAASGNADGGARYAWVTPPAGSAAGPPTAAPSAAAAGGQRRRRRSLLKRRDQVASDDDGGEDDGGGVGRQGPVVGLGGSCTDLVEVSDIIAGSSSVKRNNNNVPRRRVAAGLAKRASPPSHNWKVVTVIVPFPRLRRRGSRRPSA